MKTLSIRQPWAWLILHGGKDIENRSWHTSIRGRILIHASKGMTRDEYENAAFDASDINPDLKLPPFEELERGGIVGEVTITDCLPRSSSPWHNPGCFGFVLKDAQPLPFYPYKGALGFFECPAFK